MVFNVREAIGGFKHLGLGWTRSWRKHPDTLFIKDYEQQGLLVERAGSCSICGYAMISLELANGWHLETCSAMPVVKGFTSKEFSTWAASLSPAKLPAARV